MKLKYHNLSRYFPMLPEEEFAQLRSSIERFGQLEPITLLDGKILDGRNRYEVCIELGIEPKLRQYQTDSYKPLDFVVAANLRRRHLTETQKAQIIIDIEGMPEPMPAEHRPSLARGQDRPAERSPSYSELAREAGVSRQTVRRVARAQEYADDFREGRVEASEAEKEIKRKQREAARRAKGKTDYADLPEVAWVLDFLRVWERKFDEFDKSLEKFSPEAARFTARRLRKHADRAIQSAELFEKKGKTNGTG